jgi:hypothetical protein
MNINYEINGKKNKINFSYNSRKSWFPLLKITNI